MEHCRSPDGVTSVSVRTYYTMLSRVYLALAMGFLVLLERGYTHTHRHTMSQIPLMTISTHQIVPAWVITVIRIMPILVKKSFYNQG